SRLITVASCWPSLVARRLSALTWREVPFIARRVEAVVLRVVAVAMVNSCRKGKGRGARSPALHSSRVPPARSQLVNGLERRAGDAALHIARHAGGTACNSRESPPARRVGPGRRCPTRERRLRERVAELALGR